MIKQIASMTFTVLAFLTFLLLGGRVIRYFGMAAKGNLDISLLFSIIGYNLPYFLELILPLSFFIALMLVFGRLYVDNEMAVINSSGMSRGKVARLITPFVLILFIIEGWLSTTGKPWGVRQSESIWQQQAMQSAFDLVKPGEFISNGEYNLYVGSLADDNSELQDVILIQSGKEKDDKDTIILAKSAKQVKADANSKKIQLDMFNGRRYEVIADNANYNQISFQQYRLSLKENNDSGEVKENIETATFTKLFQIVRADDSNSLAQAELAYRLSLPWLIILAVMMSIPLAQVRPRQGRWLKLMPSILLFVCVAISFISIKEPVAEKKISVWIYPLLIIIFILSATYMNWASRINQRLQAKISTKNTTDSINIGADDL